MIRVHPLRHAGLKLLALGLAGLLWFVVSGEQVVERVLRIPLEFRGLPPHLEMSADVPAVVDVHVRGSSSTLSRVGPGEVVAVLDLQSARLGPRLFHLTTGDVRAPFGVEVTQVLPPSVSILFEESASKLVPIVPSVDGHPAEGFDVGAITTDPVMVEVQGPRSSLDKLSGAMTEPVSVRGLSSSVRESVSVGLADPTLRLRSPGQAVVTVRIDPAVQRIVDNVPVRTSGRAGTPSPSEVVVAVRGPRDLVADLVASHLDASVSVEGLAAGRHRLPVEVSVPPRITVVTVDPALVDVSVRE